MPPPASPAPPSPDRPIGVLGGLGPYAGLDLVRAVFDETAPPDGGGEVRDQDHLSVVLVSVPARIPDRSTWLADRGAPSPVPPMLDVLRLLDDAGCAVAGVPCNTAHAPDLFDALREGLTADGRALRLVHIVDAIVAHARELAPGAATVGVLATDASVRYRLHERGLEPAGYRTLVPDAAHQAQVQASIFDPAWGLKAQSHPPSDRARQILLGASDALAAGGAEAVVLGCTELPLAVPELERGGVPFLNSTRALARALIRATHPDRLRPPDAGA